MQVKTILHFYLKKNPQLIYLKFSDYILKEIHFFIFFNRKISIVCKILNIHSAEKKNMLLICKQYFCKVKYIYIFKFINHSYYIKTIYTNVNIQDLDFCQWLLKSDSAVLMKKYCSHFYFFRMKCCAKRAFDLSRTSHFMLQGFYVVSALHIHKKCTKS